MLLNKKGYHFETLVLLTYEAEIRHRVKAPSVIVLFVSSTYPRIKIPY